ncbi:MAG: cytochrome C oxidase subunit IV family protein [Chloroflexi bacterium]|nr:cytochrome C oxidase subunit IV family protein [Chloroflexota bacterium]MDA1240062.1 cytochrome C oxidase subunit IV family protein [Chloroflexota bacterium]MQC25585.1 cytochrome C oxidase subunit IV [Chloroflexota bacterium]MQC48130.1 cytochrome C oxidase subunit IV [Chloroflexota bacterium]
MDHEASAGHGHEHPPTTIRQYIIIGVILAIITAVELWVSYAGLGAIEIPLLLIMSAVKFGIVAALFMHLKFEHKIMTRMFLIGIVLATALLLAVIALFWNDATDNRVLPDRSESSAPAH